MKKQSHKKAVHSGMLLHTARREIGASASFTMIISHRILVQNDTSDKLLFDYKEVDQNATFTV